MVQETSPGASHDNEWRRRTFTVLQPDGSSYTPELREAVTEEGRIFEFYANLFESIPDDDDENAGNLVDRFRSSPVLLEGIPLGRVLNFPETQLDASREPLREVLLRKDGNLGHQLEVTCYWFKVGEIADLVKGKVAKGEV